MAYSGLAFHGSSWRFRVTITDEDGNRKQKWIRCKGCKTKKDAAAFMRRHLEGEQTTVDSSVLFPEFVDTWIEESTGLADSTRKDYRSIAENHFGQFKDRKVSTLTPDDARALKNGMKLTPTGKEYADRTKQKVLNFFGTLCQTAVARGILASNPVRKLEKRERPQATGRSFKRILLPGEIDGLLWAAGERYEALVGVAFFAGLRLNEMLQLRWRHVIFSDEGSVIHLEEDDQMHLKGTRGCKKKAANRDVEMTPRLVALLKAHRRRTPYRGPDHFVFCTASGMPYSSRNLHRALFDVEREKGTRKILKTTGWVVKAGLYDERKPIGFHVLRHNFGSNLVSSGIDIVYVSRQMGHSDPAITLRIYSHEAAHARHAGSVAAALERVFGSG